LGGLNVPKFVVTLWETREYTVPVEADNEDEAKEIADEQYMDLSTADSFVSTEIRDVEKEG
jgi:hypothetical protein